VQIKDLVQQVSKQIIWFTGLNNHNKKSYIDYLKMYKVAVKTAKMTNPTIVPYLILDGEKDEYINDLINMGVNVIHHQVNFFDSLKDFYGDNTTAYGAFLRIDIPKICESLGIESDYILYTDNDVMFMDDVTPLLNLKPKYFMCTGEFSQEFIPSLMNSGVMWINWKSMLNEYDEFVFFIKNNLQHFTAFDQDSFRIYYQHKMESFDYNYNYKPYWGYNKGIKILHFHGPKPVYTDEKLNSFEYPTLITDFFNQTKEIFNKILSEI
jgi:lipopolysaccharide biosynthesis glycosyltransferase